MNNYCALCGEDDGWVEYQSHGGAYLPLCHQCNKECEETIGYSHIMEAIQCPACNHTRYKYRRYNINDEGVAQCSVCKKYFKGLATTNPARCFHCEEEEEARRASAKSNPCPECQSEMAYSERTKINGSVMARFSCSCGYSTPEKKVGKLDELPPPKGVKPLFTEA